MDQQTEITFEARIMEPIYRMVKIVAQDDPEKAQTLMAVTVQYMTDHWMGKSITPIDVQKLLRAVLLFEDDGKYYAPYVYNELQVKIAGWLTLMAIDRPVTLGDLGSIADRVADQLAMRDCTELTSHDVLTMVKEKVAAIDEIVLERIILNEENWRSELDSILMKNKSI